MLSVSLRRITTTSRLIPEVDGFRFLAILIVVIAHIYGQCISLVASGAQPAMLQRAVGNGKLGVCLFFVISGFILALPFARHHLLGAEPVGVQRYFQRRLTRLEPPYVLAMLLRFPLVARYKHAALSGLALHLLASLFYAHSLIYGQESTINPPAWSLEVEVQFYVLAPLLTAVFLIRSGTGRRIVLALSIFASSLAAQLLIADSSRASLSLLNYSQYFFAGFLLCDIYLTQCQPRLPKAIWDILGIASLGSMLFARDVLSSSVLPWAALLLYLGGFHGRLLRGFFAFAPVSIIGGMCYSIYLTHTSVLTLTNLLASKLFRGGLSAGVVTGATFSIALVLVLAVGTIYFLLIERPCMDPNWMSSLRQRIRGISGIGPKG